MYNRLGLNRRFRTVPLSETRIGKNARHYRAATFKNRYSSRDCASSALTSLRPRPRNSASRAYSARETIRDRLHPSSPPISHNASLKWRFALVLLSKKVKNISLSNF